MLDQHRADDVRPRVVLVALVRRRPVGMQRLRLGRALGIRDRLERLVLDDDPLRRAPRLLGMVGRDDGDRLAEVAHAVDRQHRLVRELEPVRLLPRDVGVREHGVHAGKRERRGEVDREDSRVRVRAAQRVSPEHPRCRQVARVRELAGRLRRAVDALDALADAADAELAPARDAHGPRSPARRRQPDRVEDLLVAGAAAEVPGERLADLVLARVGRALEQRGGRDDQPGRAEAALHRARVDERLLHGMKVSPAPRPSTVTTSWPSACAASTRHAHTSVAVEEDGAGPALALLARVLRAGKPEPLAQRVEQALSFPDLGLERARR